MAVEFDEDHQQPEHKKYEEPIAHRRQTIHILKREVMMLEDMLRNERGTHEVLKRAHRRDPGPAISIPGFIPPKVKELLVELGEVDDEIARLERQVSTLQADLTLDQAVNRDLKSRNRLQQQQQQQQQESVSVNPQRVSFEAKTLHFISKAMKGDFTVNNDFTPLNGQVNVGTNEENGSKAWLKPQVSPLKSPRLNLTPKKEIEQRVSFDLTPKSSPSSTDTDEQHGSRGEKSQSPNKLSESIMKCLIFIYVRLHRTTRQNELEKPGGSAGCRTFRGDPINVKAIQSLQKESRQQDPYGIFSAEESIPRDIGPYKNLILFGPSSLDLKCLSSTSFVPLLRNLRGLLNNLRKVDLGSLTWNQKLAFWINMYNACVMNGFLQFGVPSSPEKLLNLMNEATLNIGGNFLNAQAIENFILRKSLNSSDTNDGKEVMARQLYGLGTHDPNVTFSLCCGTRSSPSVRIYTAEGVISELERSKQEYLQASIMVTSTGKIAVPELLFKNMKDFAQDKESLVKWICHQLPVSGLLRKSMVECFRGLKSSAVVIEKIDYDFEFQYLLANISSPY
ncbi:hypothetical protein QQ045_005495 [Rhodiola kirilowii]